MPVDTVAAQLLKLEDQPVRRLLGHQPPRQGGRGRVRSCCWPIAPVAAQYLSPCFRRCERALVRSLNRPFLGPGTSPAPQQQGDAARRRRCLRADRHRRLRRADRGRGAAAIRVAWRHRRTAAARRLCQPDRGRSRQRWRRTYRTSSLARRRTPTPRRQASDYVRLGLRDRQPRRSCFKKARAIPRPARRHKIAGLGRRAGSPAPALGRFSPCSAAYRSRRSPTRTLPRIGPPVAPPIASAPPAASRRYPTVPPPGASFAPPGIPAR